MCPLQVLRLKSPLSTAITKVNQLIMKENGWETTLSPTFTFLTQMRVKIMHGIDAVSSLIQKRSLLLLSLLLFRHYLSFIKYILVSSTIKKSHPAWLHNLRLAISADSKKQYQVLKKSQYLESYREVAENAPHRTIISNAFIETKKSIKKLTFGSFGHWLVLKKKRHVS
jgi:hypothetical protein